MTKNRTREFAYAGFYLALTIVLGYVQEMVPLIKMPNGGSIDYTIVPLFVASFHLGWKKTVPIAFLSWVLGLMLGLNNYIYTPMQTCLDYIFPVVFVGMASIFPKIEFGKKTISNVYVGIIVSMLLKYLSHVIVGAYYWFPEGEAAGSLGAWFFSGITYNLPYNAGTLILNLIVVPVLVQRLKKMNGVKFEGLKEN